MISGTHGVKAPQTYYPQKPKTQPQHFTGNTPSLSNMYSQVAQQHMVKKPKLH